MKFKNIKTYDKLLDDYLINVLSANTHMSKSLQTYKTIREKLIPNSVMLNVTEFTDVGMSYQMCAE